MKIIAITNDKSYHDQTFLVEVSKRELDQITAYQHQGKDFKIGTEIEVDGLYDLLKDIHRNKTVTKQAVRELRAFADLLESVEPSVMSAVTPPKEVTQDEPQTTDRNVQQSTTTNQQSQV